MPFTYGSRKFTTGLYGGHDEAALSAYSPGTIEVYDNTLARKATYQIGVGGFTACRFSHDESGCLDFSLRFSGFANIGRKDIIKIKVFDSLDYFFTGVVRDVPIQGATETGYIYAGYGLNDYLFRINAESQSYANKTIEFILLDLLDTIITVKSPIAKNLAKIQPPDITLATYNNNFKQVDVMLKELKDLANSEGNYNCGVDRYGDFFFLPRNTEIKAALVTGAEGRYGIDHYNPVDEFEQTTDYFLLDKDGVYIDKISGSGDFDIFERKLTAPDIDDASAEKWAQGKIDVEQQIARTAPVEWLIWPWSPISLVADGNIRIISSILPEGAEPPGAGHEYGAGTYGSGPYGGDVYQGFNLDDTLQVKKVDYELSDAVALRKIQLGSIPRQLSDDVVEINKDLQNLRISIGR